MVDDPQSTAAGSPPGPGWTQALDDLERSLREAVYAIGALRFSLGGTAAPPDGAPAMAAQSAPAPPAVEPAPGEVVQQETAEQRARSTFERLWERIELERRERDPQNGGDPGDDRKGLELLPQDYMMTVEDREGKVDLIPLHRALLGLVPVESISLLSFANGVPVISLRSDRELDLERLGSAVSAAMDRQCEVIPQDNGRLYLRLQAKPGLEA